MRLDKTSLWHHEVSLSSHHTKLTIRLFRGDSMPVWCARVDESKSEREEVLGQSAGEKIAREVRTRRTSFSFSLTFQTHFQVLLNGFKNILSLNYKFSCYKLKKKIRTVRKGREEVRKVPKFIAPPLDDVSLTLLSSTIIVRD